MSVEDLDGRILAAAGCRLAGDAPLFLEAYLDKPIETVVADRLQAPVSRRQIAEVGNLASDCRGASLFLYLALGRRLQRQGCAYVVATATAPLRRSFARLGFPTAALASAQAWRLGDAAADWGRYYDHSPEVRVGVIDPALRPLARALDQPAREPSVAAALS